jgi:maleate cis-trans isomerase
MQITIQTFSAMGLSPGVEAAKIPPVNLLAYAYAGSNPALPTIFILKELQTAQLINRLSFFFRLGH